ncbi:uncharacterized protein PHALS_06391 [Plasmopara halstedii]|uniref:Uncharacterized protein n=1 Tax=Plasmopara halstedii TaxID=4781 RepID=A0A0P1B3V1_PLAHL|nr:uncharacterized protein PHALS_06391 [Plasmopara halstedii]CEG48575.1 hypothetical protein PHALS_06391 [Plasmopara halstedii]|eukprot:XP_024584944.1 hypothetical protein PHALS_06391 [Plasmopara halstedii]
MEKKPPTKFVNHEPQLLNQSDDSNEHDKKRRKKRVRPVVDSSTTCVPEQLHCRYANKKCLNPRAIKRTGGLHTFCSIHRANANRNQRRLDMRKRMARHAIQAQDQTFLISDTVNLRQQVTHQHLSYSYASDTCFEPLHTPTPLLEEDILMLVSLFLPQQDSALENTFEVALDTTASHDRSLTPNGKRQRKAASP